MTTRSSEILRRWRHLDAERRALLVQAAIVLSGASAAVAVLPFDRAIRFGSISRGCPRDLDTAKYVGAVETAAKYLPMRTMCIEKGLAAQRLLRRAGADARLHYGARHHPQTGKLEAHVWVSVEGINVIGGEEAADFAEVATYA